MLECFSVRVADNEAGIAVAQRPVERKRDLVRALLHSGAPGGLVAAGCGTGPGGGWTATGGGGGGSAGGLFEADLSVTTLPPEVVTIHPRPLKAAASWAMLPL